MTTVWKAAEPKLTLGMTRLLREPSQYLPADAKVGFVGNYNAVDERGTPFIRLLHEHSGISLQAIFAPEHGLWAAAQAGVRVGHEVDQHTGVPVHSLYGETFKPTPEMLHDIDVLLIDARDSGCRYTTGSSTMALCLEAAAENNKPVVITDRPNPLGGQKVEGGVLKPGFESFVGFHTLAVRHGMTAAELASMYRAEAGLDTELTIVPMEGYRRDMLYPETGLLWVSSPNMPGFETQCVYPATCLFEGTSCSEGRGTAKPFRLIGSPWLDEIQLADALNGISLKGVVFRPARFLPMFSKHEQEVCRGVEVHVTDPERLQPVEIGVHMIYEVRRQDPDKFAWKGFEDLTTGRRLFIDLLTGSEYLRRAMDDGQTPEDIMAEWAGDLEEFRSRRTQHLVYD